MKHRVAFQGKKTEDSRVEGEKLSRVGHAGFLFSNTTIVLDPGAGPRIDDHGDDVLIASACGKRKYVLT